MNELQVFQSSDFGKVRVVSIDGEPWCVAKDVCEVLGIKKYRDAVSKLDEDERMSAKVDTLGGMQEITVINESAVYYFTFRSQKENARRFRKWVTSEVLPKIRKTGSYTPQLPQSFSEALQLAADQAKQIEQQRPAVEFYKAVTDSKTAIPMSQVAKVLDMGIGRNKLFAQLRDKGILRANNEPYQDYVDRGWFRVVEQKYTKPDGDTQINIKTLVYQKGIDGIRRIIQEAK